MLGLGHPITQWNCPRRVARCVSASAAAGSRPPGRGVHSEPSSSRMMSARSCNSPAMKCVRCCCGNAMKMSPRRSPSVPIPATRPRHYTHYAVRRRFVTRNEAEPRDARDRAGPSNHPVLGWGQLWDHQFQWWCTFAHQISCSETRDRAGPSDHPVLGSFLAKMKISKSQKSKNEF